LSKPNLLPKTPYKPSSKPPKPKVNKEEVKRGKENQILNINHHKEERSSSKISNISQDKIPKVAKKSKVRPITSDTHRPYTSKKQLKNTMPVSLSIVIFYS